jgi:hypothetical protein
VTAWVQTDAVWSLHHQHRDLHQLTYPVPLRRSGFIQPSRTHAEPPPLSLSAHATEPLFKSNAGHRPVPILPLLLPSTPEPPKPHTAFLSRHSCSSPGHRAPLAVRIWPAPPSEPLLSQSTTHTHLSLSL